MAAASWPAPGTEYGPCDVPCAHPDCAEIRRDAEAPCAICGNPIGYDTSWMHNTEGDAACHADCLYAEADRLRAEAAW